MILALWLLQGHKSEITKQTQDHDRETHKITPEKRAGQPVPRSDGRER